MNRYEKLFSQLNINKLGAFIPFVVLGDPDPNSSINIIYKLIESGSDALELSIPFSDPLSDGIIIQKSIQRSFQSGTNFSICFKIIENIRKKYPNIPIGLLIYANLIFNYGIKNFYSLCEKIKIDSILIPDLPFEESQPFYKSSISYNISQIFICPPNADTYLIRQLATYSKGYIYLTSRSGVTGLNKKQTINQFSLKKSIKLIRQQSCFIPILQGFGIYKPSQARTAYLAGTSGIITGSAISDIIEKNIQNKQCLLNQLKKFVHSMKSSMVSQ